MHSQFQTTNKRSNATPADSPGPGGLFSAQHDDDVDAGQLRGAISMKLMSFGGID